MPTVKRKPRHWNFTPALIDPRWSHLWRHGEGLHLPMTEGGGDLLHDASGFGHNGIIDGAEWVDTEEGLALSFVSANTDFVNLEGITGIGTFTNKEPFTVLTIVSTSANGTDRICADWNSSGIDSSFGMELDASERWKCHIGRGGTTVSSIGNVRVAGKRTTLAARYSGDTSAGRTITLFEDGVDQGESSTHSPGMNDGVDFRIGRNGAHNGGYWDGLIYYFNIIPFFMSDEEIWRWHNDPFGIIRRAPRILGTAPVDGNVLVAPAPASMSAVSVAPTVVLGSLSLSPTLADMSKVSVDPTVLNFVTLSPAFADMSKVSVGPTVIQGSISLSPALAGMSKVSVDPTVVLGSLSLTPANAGMSKVSVDPTVILGSLSITPSPASMSKVSVDPTVLDGGDVVVSPSPASMSKVSVDPTVVLGSLSITPANAGMSKVSAIGTVTAGGFQITFNGQQIPNNVSTADLNLTPRNWKVFLPPVGDGTGDTVDVDVEIEIRVLQESNLTVCTADGHRVDEMHHFDKLGVVSTSDARHPWRIVYRLLEV